VKHTRFHPDVPAPPLRSTRSASTRDGACGRRPVCRTASRRPRWVARDLASHSARWIISRRRRRGRRTTRQRDQAGLARASAELAVTGVWSRSDAAMRECLGVMEGCRLEGERTRGRNRPVTISVVRDRQGRRPREISRMGTSNRKGEGTGKARGHKISYDSHGRREEVLGSIRCEEPVLRPRRFPVGSSEW